MWVKCLLGCQSEPSQILMHFDSVLLVVCLYPQYTHRQAYLVHDWKLKGAQVRSCINYLGH